MSKLYEYFKNLNKNDKLSHAFLIGNTTYEEIKDELFKVFDEFILNSKGNVESNPNIYILEENNGIIKKEEIRELINKLSTTAQFNESKIYVIDKSEKLSDFSYNAILKTLEEPAENVYAFLLTTNMAAMKSTIVSRCQKIFISSGIYDKYEEDAKKSGDILIENIEKYGIDTLLKIPKIYKEIEDRKKFLNILKYMLDLYIESLNSFISKGTIENELLSNNDMNSFTKKILVINDNIVRVNNYLNKNISIDRLVIEMSRCNI